MLATSSDAVVAMNNLALPKSRKLPLNPCGSAFSLRLCSVCDVGDFCMGRQDGDRMRSLDAYVEHSGSYPAGTYLFREGDPFGSLVVVRTGTVKLFMVEPSGAEQIVGFAQAGDAIGLDAIHGSRHGCHAMALDTVSLCQLPFPMVTQVAAALPALQRSLLNLLSRHISNTYLLFGRYSAEQRLAVFFVLLSRHAQRRGLSPTRLRLGMPRTDIANYLRLTPETISRMLRRFQQQALLRIDRREVEILDGDALIATAGSILRD